MSVGKQFLKYIPQNILGMVGISLYILADTFFISKSVGADGITALNLVLPVYSVIFSIGAMIGVGSAIRFAIAKSRQSKDTDSYFSNGLFWGTAIGLAFALAGLIFPDKILALMGGDEEIVRVGTSYTRIFMIFSPCFIWNHTCNAFVRNDGAPLRAMIATLSSSLFNIVADYVLMFPLGLGMSGAALATAISPVIGVGVCLTHILSKKSNVKLKLIKPSFSRLIRSCQLGVSAFVAEISSGVMTATFNMLILGLTGNVGVASYGVVANISLVATAMFNGVANGSQPIASTFYGQGEKSKLKELLKLGFITAIGMSAVMIAIVYIWSAPLANIFNGENNKILAEYAEEGLKLYFTGFVFAGINIVGTSILSAMEEAKGAFIASVMRGFVAIVAFAFLLSAIWGMKGVWLAFPAAEGVTVIITVIMLKKAFSNKNKEDA